MPWVILGESVVGTSHCERNCPCQDAFRFGRLGRNEEFLVVAVADGAGSAAHSEIGATLACDEFLRIASEVEPETLLLPEVLSSLVAKARNAVVEESQRRLLAPRELASTFLVAVAGPNSATFAQNGDGAIVFGIGTEYQTAFWPEPAEYANATDFLTDDGFPTALRVQTFTEVVMDLAVLTDGLQRLALDFAGRTPYQPFFAPLFQELRAVSEIEALNDPFRAFLGSARVNERTDDDKTLVIASRRP
ncbi:MAG: PP2C family serine/threonine-protein phosphatase [Gemmataceae bacterium]